MCYDFQAQLKTQLKWAIKEGRVKEIEEIRKKLVDLGVYDYFHTSGFNHEKFVISTQNGAFLVASWGLIPGYTKGIDAKNKIINSTLNARLETIFDKPSFKNSAHFKRAILHVDGFYEHHHFKKEVYPFLISHKNKEPMCIAVLWDEWKNPESGKLEVSFSVVTTRGNKVMSAIHNNPKLEEARMPLIITGSEELWLNYSPEKEKEIRAIAQEQELEYITVNKLRGKKYLGNKVEATQPFIYEELEFSIK